MRGKATWDWEDERKRGEKQMDERIREKSVRIYKKRMRG